jgi:hypothetical protein
VTKKSVTGSRPQGISSTSKIQLSTGMTLTSGSAFVVLSHYRTDGSPPGTACGIRTLGIPFFPAIPSYGLRWKWELKGVTTRLILSR